MGCLPTPCLYHCCRAFSWNRQNMQRSTFCTMAGYSTAIFLSGLSSISYWKSVIITRLALALVAGSLWICCYLGPGDHGLSLLGLQFHCEFVVVRPSRVQWILQAARATSASVAASTYYGNCLPDELQSSRKYLPCLYRDFLGPWLWRPLNLQTHRHRLRVQGRGWMRSNPP